MSEEINETDEGIDSKILVVDDRQNIRSTLSVILSEMGYKVDTAEDGAQGFEMYKQNKYGLILTDNDMPVADGLQLLKNIKLHGNGVPVVLMSGGIVQYQWDREGFVDFLEKPFGYNILKQCIDKYVKQNPQ